MGLAKWSLPFGPERMLDRVVRLLGEVVRPIVVVAAGGQVLRDLPAGVALAVDRKPGQGPLGGLLAGLAAMPENVDAAFAVGCDVPLLVPGIVPRLVGLIGTAAVAIPESNGHRHPLLAVYRRTLTPQIERLLARNRLRCQDLVDEVPTRFVATDELLDADPQLLSLRNVNSPADYVDALEAAGLTAPVETLRQLRLAGH
jgi:molybdopterin-guanine dinucleotide biosynthesis protein A